MSGHDIVVSAFPNGNWGLGIVDPKWRLSIGSEYYVRLVFDNSNPIDLIGKVRPDRMIFVTLSNTPEYINLFRYAAVLYITIGQNVYNFNLTNTKALLPSLFDCVSNSYNNNSNQKYERKDSKNDSQSNPEISSVKEKIINDIGIEYNDCIDRELKLIVPYSSEGAEVIAQAIITKCKSILQKYIETSMAVYGLNRVDVEKIVNVSVEKRKNTILADIVTFRAALNKAIASGSSQKPKESKEQGL